MVHASSSSAEDYEPLYEESVVLLKAPDSKRAEEKAVTLGREREQTYQNQYGEAITWSFLMIADVKEWHPAVLEDGAEVYGRFFRDLVAYRSLARKEES